MITETPDGEIEMTGPAVIVAEGEIDAEWLDAARKVGRLSGVTPARWPSPPRQPASRGLETVNLRAFARMGDPFHARREAVSGT